MVIVLAVVLTVAGVAAIHEAREERRMGLRRGDMPEEVLARQMPGEYPQYRKLFDMQARSNLLLPLHR